MTGSKVSAGAGDMKWQGQAACRGADPQRFVYARRGEVELDRLHRSREAVDEFCHGCPVIDECYKFAHRRQYSGVWGGCLLECGKAQLLPSGSRV